jgi:hypothetical protein
MMSELRYMPLISPKRTGIAMSGALGNFQIHCALKGIGSATEQEIRNFIESEYGPKLAAKFKVSYLVPSPLNHRGSEEPCQ